MTETRWSYPQRTFFAAAIVVGLLLLWQLADVVVLTFGAIGVACIVRGLARRYEQWFRLSTHKSGILHLGRANDLRVVAPHCGRWQNL